MTIVFLSPKFYPDVGGVEKHSFEVAKILAKKHKVIVLTEGSKDRNENIDRIKIIRLAFGKNGWFKKFRIWLRILSHKKLIEKADIVHCHDVFFWYLPLRIIFPRKKVFITFHGYETVYPPKLSAIFIRKLSEKLSNGNIAVGKYIEKWYGTKASAIIYGAFDKVKVPKLKIRSSKLRILFIGRIEKDTGVKIYSEVLKKLKKYDFEAVGDGVLRSEFEKFGKVHGFVKNLKTYVKRADVIFSSSYLSIMEGLNFKKPVFSVFENPLKEDYLKMTPFSKWIYIAGSPAKMLSQIEKILRNKKLREKNSILAYNWIRVQTWERVTKKYLELWNI